MFIIFQLTIIFCNSHSGKILIWSWKLTLFCHLSHQFQSLLKVLVLILSLLLGRIIPEDEVQMSHSNHLMKV